MVPFDGSCFHHNKNTFVSVLFGIESAIKAEANFIKQFIHSIGPSCLYYERHNLHCNTLRDSTALKNVNHASA